MRLENKSRKLAFLLRHDSSYKFDVHGWREVSDLIEYHGFTLDELCEIVDTNNKRRFEFSSDMSRIRARQGHSVNVNVELEEQTPPDILYHGTSHDRIGSILSEGITPQARLHVHLSSTIETALDVGRRHGKPVVFRVDAKKMSKNGIVFYKSRNGVWLTVKVDARFIDLIRDEEF